MINYWWITRPKRRLNSIPEVLASISKESLNAQWAGQIDAHLSVEEALEEAGLKRKGDRRDQTGGGARTYIAWVKSLGLMFEQESTKQLKLTLAGEAILAGESPVKILTSQILKYQFPSSFSLSRNVNVSPRFKIHPFVFLFRLLDDKRIVNLSNDEIAKIVITEAENESEKCFENIVARILEYRERGNSCLDEDFAVKYASSKGEANADNPFDHLGDIANTIMNWMEYTQLAVRIDGKLQIIPEKTDTVKSILSKTYKFIDHPENHENFQRKYGLDLKHTKDTRNLLKSDSITSSMLIESQIKHAFIVESLKKPICRITSSLIESISEKTGCNAKVVEEKLCKLYPNGAIGSFMTEYFNMAFKGTEQAADFEKATVELFRDVFGYETEHVGPIGLTPDVLLVSDSDGYQAIFDNKAYSSYSISNDHRNRMIHNYIENLGKYSKHSHPLAFFSYIAGGFGNKIDSQIQSVVQETGISGSAISVSNVISLVEKHQSNPYSHKQLKDLFSLERQILLSDL